MKFKVLLINLGVFLILLAGLEFISFWLVKNHLQKFAQADNQIAPQFNLYPTIDPLLGWTIGRKQAEDLGLSYVDGYVVYGSQHLQNPDAIRVAVFGGSTSDTVFSQNTWVKGFHEALNKAWGPTVVFNGAVGGYNSHQELLKVVRDIEYLHPNLILTYNGANELQGSQLPEQPMVTTYEHQIYAKFIRASQVGFPYLVSLVKAVKSPHFTAAIEGQFAGPTNPALSHELWLKNISLIKATAEMFGAQFHGILQPVLGIGGYQLSQREEKIRTTNEFSQRNPAFYSRAIEITKSRPYLTDLTEALNSLADVYIDDCHLIKEADALMAKKVSEVILRTYTDTIRNKRETIH